MNPLLALTPPRLDHARPQPQPFTFAPGGTQFLAVSGTLTDRFLVTFRADARQLRALVPEPFELDTHAGYGFLSVCAVEIAGMGLAGTPGFMRWQNREFLYRLGVRLGGEATFITLRSEVSSPVLALLGRYFSHYRPVFGEIELVRNGERVRMTAGNGEAELEVDLRGATTPGSVFASENQAADFLLGQKFSADVVRGRVRVQAIEHAAWQPRFVTTRTARFAFVEQLGQRLGARFELDSTLAVHDVPHVWKAARWL